MKRWISGALLLVMLVSLIVPVGAAEAPYIIRLDYEGGEIGTGNYRKSSNSVTVEQEANGNRYLSMVMDNPVTEDMYYQLQADKFTSDYGTDDAATTQTHYFASTAFTVSVSLSTAGTPAYGNLLQFKSTNKAATQDLLIGNAAGEVKSKGGTLLGSLAAGQWLDCTVTFDLVSRTAVYFIAGEQKATETLSSTAQNVSYFNLSLNKNSAGGSSLLADNLTVSYGTVNATDTDYFAAVFPSAPTVEPGTDDPGTDTPGTDDPGAGEDNVHSLVQRDFEDGVIGKSFRGGICTVAGDGTNSYLRIAMDGANDCFYHIDADESGDFLVDDSASKNKNYFNSDTLVLAFDISRAAAEVPSGTVQIKSTGSPQAMASLFTFSNSAGLKTHGGTVLAALEEGKWLSVALEINTADKTLVYYIDGKEAATESLTYASDKISYFNISVGANHGGKEVLFDNLLMGYGALTPTFFMTPVSFRIDGTLTTRYYEGDTFLLPDDAPYWMGTVGGSAVLCAAGDSLPLTTGLLFTANRCEISMLDGASIRLDARTGLRFGASVSGEDFEALRNAFGNENVEVGILIVPSDYLEGETEFSLSALSAKYPTLATVTSRIWAESKDGRYYFYGTLSDMQDHNLARRFSAIAYYSVTTADGSRQEIYSAYDPAKNARSAYEVASAAFSDSLGYPISAKKAIASYLDGVLSLEVGADDTCRIAAGPAGYTSPYTIESTASGKVTVTATGEGVFRSVLVNGTPVYGLKAENGRLTVDYKEGN